MLAASVDEPGKLFAGALKERTQLALFLCIAVCSTGCNHEEPCYFCRSAAQCLLLCCWLLPATTKSVVARTSVEECRAPIPAKEAGTGPVASVKPWSNVSAIVTDHMQSPPCLFFFYNDISLLFPVICSGSICTNLSVEYAIARHHR